VRDPGVTGSVAVASSVVVLIVNWFVTSTPSSAKSGAP
jgi:hypothetical protein